MIQTKENEICYSEENNNSICFYDISERKIKTWQAATLAETAKSWQYDNRQRR